MACKRYFETAGMRLSNGEVIYTDPLNADTDGDGIKDGDEVVMGGFGSINAVHNGDGSYTFTTSYGIKFYMKSNPTMSDTDGDNYNDKIDPRPLKCDVFKYALKNEEYIKVSYANEISYGGNQNWFQNETDIDNRIKDFGCGLIAATDLVLYESQKDSKWTDFFKKFNLYNNGVFLYDCYKDIVYDFEQNYFNVLPSIGVNGVSLQVGMNKLMNDYSLNYSADWGVPKEQMLSVIINRIQNDHPVIISVAPELFSNKIEFGNYKNVEFSYTGEYVVGHYMIITCVYVDDIKNEVYLKLSSWGSEYYIKFDDYIASINTHQHIGTSVNNTMVELFNNILYIY